MIFGYARVSSDDQNLDLQRDALARAGCQKVFEDKASGAGAPRPGLDSLLSGLRDGDVVVIWRLDRLGRSLKDLIALVEKLDAEGVSLVSLHEHIDTTSSSGKFMFHIFGALSEFVRTIIRENAASGLSAARARGRVGGRKKKLDPAKRELAVRLYKERQHTAGEICKIMGIGRSTLYAYLSEAAGGGEGIDRSLTPATGAGI